jgi:hypothetical protein
MTADTSARRIVAYLVYITLLLSTQDQPCVLLQAALFDMHSLLYKGRMLATLERWTHVQRQELLTCV